MPKISRSKIELYTDCPRCFWLDQVKGVKRPSMPAFTLNSAVDHLLKKEFDIYRVKREAHPLMAEFKLNMIPFNHEQMDEWRNNFKGVRATHEATGLEIFGAVDDIWVDTDGVLYVVDYKSTAKDGEVELTDAKWHMAYKRQMEVYQWLLRQNNFEVSNTGYFVYVNGDKSAERFGETLKFNTKLITYTGSDKWIEPTLTNIKECLESEIIPVAGADCEYCAYRNSSSSYEIY